MQRNKNVQYDADDLYDSADEEEYGGEVPEYTTEDKDNFATLTPVVRAELEETGLSASQTEIEEALWHYYWDVGKSVSYLKNSRTPRPQQQPSEGGGKKGQAKAKSKFDQAAEKSAEKAGESDMFFALPVCCETVKMDRGIASMRISGTRQRGGCCSALLS